MKRWEPIAYPGPDNVHGAATHRNFNQSTGERGSWPDAEGYQQNVIDEPSALVEKSGFALEGSTSDQMTRAVRSQRLNYIAAVGGTANALTVTLDPAPASMATLIGTPFWIIPATNNTGAATINFNALGAINLRRRGGLALQPADLLAGEPVRVMPISAIEVRVVSALGAAASRGIQVLMGSGQPGSSGNWTVPAGVTEIEVMIWGGGAGGSGSNSAQYGSGSGGGEFRFGVFSVTPGQVLAYVIGAGGNGGASGGGAGGGGGVSSLGALISAAGGLSGINQSTPGGGGTGGAGGDYSIPGQGGNGSIPGTTTGMIAIGGDAGGSGGKGGTGGSASTNPGGGGAGSITNAAGGNGSSGGIIIRWRS